MDLREHIRAVLLENIFKQLERDNYRTLPKVPTKNVFFHDIADITKIRANADVYFKDDKFKTLPLEWIDVHDIVPTQKNLTINNLKDTQNVDPETGAYLMKYNNKYYILDGHHRIANAILKQEPKIKGFVYDQVPLQEPSGPVQ